MVSIKSARKPSVPNIPGLSTSAWPRVRIDPLLLEKDWRTPPTTSAEERRLEKSGLIWRSDAEGEISPFIIFPVGDDRYDVQAAYEAATKRRNPRLSPHCALRLVARPRDALDFLKNFGPL